MVWTCCLLLPLAAWRAEAAIVSWVGGSGDWNIATNWSTGALPGPGDDVVISPVTTSIAVTHSLGTHTVNSLMSEVAFQLTGGSLKVATTLQVNNTFTLSGGTLAMATIYKGANTNSLFVVNGSGGTLSGVTVNGVLLMDNFTLLGTLQVGLPYGGQRLGA